VPDFRCEPIREDSQQGCQRNDQPT
jgi:hypothetical protein